MFCVHSLYHYLRHISENNKKHFLLVDLFATQYLNGKGLFGSRFYAVLISKNPSKLHVQQIPHEDLLPLLIFIHFCYLVYSLAFVSYTSSASWYRPGFICSGLTYEIYSGGDPFMYVYCMVCYCVIAAPCVRSVVTLHTITPLMTIGNAQRILRAL